jgi:hypothetical protein
VPVGIVERIMSTPEREHTPRHDERRKSVRYACILEAVWKEGERTRYRPGWPARVMNISLDGIALHSGENFPPETVLTIGLQGHTSKQSRVEMRVVHTTPQPNATWLIGGAFLTPLDPDTLEKLLGEEV